MGFGLVRGWGKGEGLGLGFGVWGLGVVRKHSLEDHSALSGSPVMEPAGIQQAMVKIQPPSHRQGGPSVRANEQMRARTSTQDNFPNEAERAIGRAASCFLSTEDREMEAVHGKHQDASLSAAGMAAKGPQQGLAGCGLTFRGTRVRRVARRGAARSPGWNQRRVPCCICRYSSFRAASCPPTASRPADPARRFDLIPFGSEEVRGTPNSFEKTICRARRAGP